MVVTTLIGLVLIFYTLIFINPRIAFNPFKPPLPTPEMISALPVLPATWTPTTTPMPSATATALPPATATLVVQPLPSPTQGPINTLVIIPTATLRPPTRTPTPINTTAPTIAATATAASSPYSYRATLNCSHSGGTQIKGTVTNGGTPQEGARIRVATGPDASAVIEGGEQVTRRQPDGSAGYAFVLMPIGAFDSPATWYIWIVDGAGVPLSDPNFHFQTNNFPRDNSLACWLAIVDFVR
jgi:hypothetical protein